MTASFSLDDVDLVRLDILASRLASLLKAGDVIALSGPLGAGKTTFARALVTRLDGEGEVPSPTFALMQRYETPRLTLTHCDFYRLEPAELDELGLDDALSEGVVLIEWPERAAGWLPADRLDIAMDETATPNERRIVLTGHGGWEPRLERLRADGELPRPDALCRGTRPLSARRRLDALLCAARAAGSRGHLDEFSAPTGRAADPRRQAV